MSILAIDVITRLPFELEAMLEADPFFSDIPVVVADRGNVEEEIKKKRIAISSKGGKTGVGVIILPLVADDEDPNIPSGPMDLRPAFQVFEQREINRLPSTGTGKSSIRIARKIRNVIKGRQLIGIVGSLNPDKPCIEPVTFEGKKDLVGHQVNFICKEADSEIVQRCLIPVFSRVGDNITIASQTDGAQIYYTTDDSFPWSGNTNATLYTGAVAIPAEGLTLRACAFKADHIGSSVARTIYAHS